MNNSEEILVKTLLEDSIKSGKIEKNNYKVHKLTGDASTRRYYRITCDKNTFVICLDRPLEVGVISNFEQVQNILSRHDIRVPKIYDSSPEKGYSLQEDLGVDTLLSKLALIDGLNTELTWYKVLVNFISSLAKVPKESYENTCVSGYKFDVEKFDWEIKFSIDNLLVKMMGFSDKDQRIEKIKSDFHKINLELAQEKMILCHRDLHSRNIMYKDGEFVLIDFQDARPGNHAYDLVSLLEDCYYDIDAKNKEILKDQAFQWSLELNLVKDRNHFERNYSLMTLQRTFKALGSFGYIYVNRQDERYLKYIHAGIERLKLHLFKLELNDLRKNLISILYEH